MAGMPSRCPGLWLLLAVFVFPVTSAERSSPSLTSTALRANSLTGRSGHFGMANSTP
jgi:hypothetical protein